MDFFSFLQIVIIKVFMITLLRFADYEIALILKMDINATPMVKRVARRAFIFSICNMHYIFSFILFCYLGFYYHT